MNNPDTISWCKYCEKIVDTIQCFKSKGRSHKKTIVMRCVNCNRCLGKPVVRNKEEAIKNQRKFRSKIEDKVTNAAKILDKKKPGWTKLKDSDTLVYGTNKCGCGVFFEDGKWEANVVCNDDILFMPPQDNESKAKKEAENKLRELCT